MLQQEEEQNWDAEVKGRERLFVLHYCTDNSTFLNATASYKAAYQKFDKKTGKAIKLDNKVCEAASSRLLKRERVKLAISRLLKEAQVDVDEKTTYQILHDLFLFSDYNPAEIIKTDGTLKKDIKDLGELAKCITGVTQTKFGPKYSLIDRSKYLGMLLEYLKLVRPEIHIDAQLPVIEMVKKITDPEEWNKKAEKL